VLLNESLSRIDWLAPWWQPWRELAQSVTVRMLKRCSVHEALNAAWGAIDYAPVRFVPQSCLPEGMAYEAFIFETRTVPTRDNLHDFFNGLAWLRFPLIKARLNALQYAQINAHGVQQLRGPLRDALTLFDENAAFLSADLHAPVIEALRARDWQSAFQTHRHLLAANPPVLFGHALLEKLGSPYKSITAHVFPASNAHLFIATSDIAVLDAAVAAQLNVQSLQPKPFAPLPVLGVPNWWPANDRSDFYADSTVFRPPRT
jgi:Protein of unknown function (DUF3025)